jgi:transcription termination factor Rho
MLLPELQSIAGSLGITGTGRMRKGDLIAAIQERQQTGPGAATAATGRGGSRVRTAVAAEEPREEIRAEVRADEVVSGRASRPAGPPEPRADAVAGGVDLRAEAPARIDDAGRIENGSRTPEAVVADNGGRVEALVRADDAPRVDEAVRTDDGGPVEDGGRAAEVVTGGRSGRGERDGRDNRDNRESRNGRDRDSRDRDGRDRDSRDRDTRDTRDSRDSRDRDTRDSRDRDTRDSRDRDRDSRDRDARDRDGDDDGGEGGRRGRRNRYRDRRRGRNERGGEGGGGSEPQVTEDDVLIPVAGILDVLDNYAFVRTSGYLAGPNDVYVSMAQVRKHGLRRGDAITGVVRAPREGEARRDKYNPLVRLDTINGMDPEEARRRPEFYKLTPLYPQQRLRLETEPHILTTRVIDLIMPLGKGQRALIQSPPKAGKTTVLQQVANAITTNSPECHLMVVLVDERPEEVTDMQRSVKGEVIASTFDRPPSDHITVAELAIERAKRLVELGMDVVVMLDSITRLGRAYNNATPASGRIMSGGIDSTALYPPKRFLGAARNIENGGSLTILGTALVETGSVMDTVIFEEFKATGNAELKLDRKIADKRIFPAIDIDQSSTRKEEILLAPDELAIIFKLRRVLHSLESQAALDLLLSRLKENRTNIEFLMQIAKTTPGD